MDRIFFRGRLDITLGLVLVFDAYLDYMDPCRANIHPTLTAAARYWPEIGPTQQTELLGSTLD